MFDLSFKASGIHLSYLITALGLVAMEDRVYADDQTEAQKTDTSVIAEGISSNPGAVDVRTGTGELADTIEGLVGLPRDTGVFLGGVWVADAICLLTGGADPGKWSFNRLLILGAGLDAKKLVGWPGGRFGVEFLQFNGEHTNRQAGSVQGYNSLPGPDPLHRSELYQLGGDRSFSIESSSSDSAKSRRQTISTMCCVRCRFRISISQSRRFQDCFTRRSF